MATRDGIGSSTSLSAAAGLLPRGGVRLRALVLIR